LKDLLILCKLAYDRDVEVLRIPAVQ